MTQDHPRPRPTHTVIVPGVMAVADVVAALMGAHCTFTVEYRERDVWHIGIFGDGLRVVTDLLGGDVGRFVCPVCGMASSHPADLREGYCGNCHDYTASTGRTPRSTG